MRRALVTGGSGAIGGAVARRLAADGLEVLVHAHHRRGAADAVVADIRGAGGSSLAIVFDVRDGSATRAALESALADGPIQVLVNNAGVHDDAPLAGMRLEQWQSVIEVHLCAAEARLAVDARLALRLASEAFLLHWYEVGRGLTRLLRYRRASARIA